MRAAMLVLDPIFEADLPSEQYAYRQGRNAQQAAIDVQETLFRGHPFESDSRHQRSAIVCDHLQMQMLTGRSKADAQVQRI